MRIKSFLILIAILFLVGLVFAYAGSFKLASNWTLISFLPFSLDGALIIMKIENEAKKFTKNL